MLNAPDYTRTCSCSYPNQTSLALIHMPGVEQWVTYYGAAAAGAVRDIGINLGAPGNRRAPDGRFWVAHPLLPHIDNPEKESGLSVAVEVVAPPSAYYTRHVSSTEGPLNWVAASGCRGVERVEVALNTTEPVQCRVDLVFAEPEFEGPGQRRFDLRIEGETLARDVDVYAAAGGHHRALVQRYDHIAVSDGALTVELSPSGAGSAPAILSGLAISVRD